MAVRFLIFVLLIVAFSGGRSDAQTGAPARAPEDAVQAALLFNFGKFVTWPAAASPKDGPFRICLWREPSLLEALREIAAQKTIGGRAVEILVLSDEAPLDSCRILYLPAGADPPPDLRRLAAERHLLTVGVGDNPIRPGIMIQMAHDSGRIALEINDEEAWRADLRIDVGLLDIARRVIPRPRTPRP